jgi:murein DD-endopeptidase MepM/ murein hydrolase activator NlpD
VFPKSPKRSPGPLDNLPRPLSERDRPPRGRRRLLALVTVTVVVGSVVGASQIAGSVAMPPAGQVAGAVGTPAAKASGGGPNLNGASQAPTGPRLLGPPTLGSEAVDTARHRAAGAPPVWTLTGYRWPLPHARVTLPFGPTPWGSRLVEGKAFHDGVDLATFCGDRIVAAHSGTVLAAGRHYDKQMGWDGDLEPYLKRLDKKHLWSTLPIVVVIDDGNGYRSIYAHFGKITVKRGQTVKAGKLIGYEGMTGRASGCHLHYGLFSPAETARFAIEPDVAKRMKLPRHEIARLDPLRVLPTRTKAPKPTPTPDRNAEPTPTPSPETVG